MSSKIVPFLDPSTGQFPNNLIRTVVRPRLALIGDDSLYAHIRYLMPETAKRGGQKFSLAITSDYMTNPGGHTIVGSGFMTPGDMRSAYQAGHELIAHSDTHPDMTSISAAARQSEWDTPKSLIESTVGVVGVCKNWVYPVSTSNLATDLEAWGRYEHVLTGVNDTGGLKPYRFAQGALDLPTNKFARYSWNDVGHAATLAQIASLVPGDSMILYTHNMIGQSLSNSITFAELVELLDLCVRLNIEMVTVSKMLPKSAIDDPNFADSSLQYIAPVGSLVSGAAVQATGQTITNLGGSTALHISRTITTAGANQMYQTRRVPCPIPAAAGAGVPITVAGRVKHTNKTGGTGGATLMALGVGEGGNHTGNNAESAAAATDGNYNQLPVVWTPTITAGVADVGYEVRYRLHDCDGDAFYTHIHTGPLADGVLG